MTSCSCLKALFSRAICLGETDGTRPLSRSLALIHTLTLSRPLALICSVSHSLSSTLLLIIAIALILSLTLSLTRSLFPISLSFPVFFLPCFCVSLYSPSPPRLTLTLISLFSPSLSPSARC